MKVHTHHILFPVLVMIFACSNSSAGEANQNMNTTRNAFPGLPVRELIDSLQIDKDLISIYIDKSNYTLQLKCDTTIIKTYPIVFGSDPVNDKRREGDHCTPEGEFQLRATYPHKKWSKFLWIDYPTAESWKKYNNAKESGEIPAQASIGGEIGIHGVPDHNDALIDKKENWTLGCISLKNKDVDEIYDVVKTGTKVVITR